MKNLIPLFAALAVSLAGCNSGMKRCKADRADRIAKVAALLPASDPVKRQEKVESLAAEQCKAMETSCKSAADPKPDVCAKYFP